MFSLSLPFSKMLSSSFRAKGAFKTVSVTSLDALYLRTTMMVLLHRCPFFSNKLFLITLLNWLCSIPLKMRLLQQLVSEVGYSVLIGGIEMTGRRGTGHPFCIFSISPSLDQIKQSVFGNGEDVIRHSAPPVGTRISKRTTENSLGKNQSLKQIMIY